MPVRTKNEATSVGEYLAALRPKERAALENLRNTILAAVPGAEERISYKLPAVFLDGKAVVWYGAAEKHCAFYPGAVVEAFADELAGYATSKGTIRFPPDAPLPAGLVRKLVKAAIAKRAKPKATSGKRRSGSS
jgi:uncharacterized protein YdhG (YjbR/CyaY superfamily)